MNYIAEIRAFYDWLQFNSVPADAQALWHSLMQLNNKCAIKVGADWLWRVEFTVSNTTLLSILKFSRQQLDRMRNALVQSGRIVYRKGKGNQSGAYRMIPFDANYVTQNVTHSDTQVVTQVWTQSGHICCTLNNYNNNPNSNSFSGEREKNGKVAEGDSPPSGSAGKEKPDAKVLADRFARFWEAWPHKVAMKKAESAFNKLAPSEDLLIKILAGIERAKKYDKRFKDGFTPNASTWLDDKGWNDSPARKPSQSSSYDIEEYEKMLNQGSW